ncbi:unnamed protein product [Sphagnum jensenii]|uniref:MI domain-containing protein n=1 Tax=Sphagnum jensenii TaxID=128206 RepID=A0ABP1ATR6_9BRYO
MKKRGSRTKFEEYLEMEQKKKTAGVTAEEDLALERRLAKKLKVKEGKLSVCIGDGIDDILDGINSGVATEEEMEIPSMEEVVPKVEVSRSKKRRREVIPPPQISTSVEAPKVQVLASKKRKNVAPEIGTIARKKKVQENDDVKEASAMKMEDAEVVVEEVKYIPPHLREKMSNESEELVRIQRRVRGLLNRLSEANVESIASEISSLFQVYGRRSVTEIVTTEIIGACCGGPRGNDQYAAVFAAYVAGTAAMVGMDFGAKFLASLATAFEEQYEKVDSLALRNLTLLFSHLFSFSLVSSELVYELLALLCKRFEELDVSTILILLQSCGMALRAADPASMKEFIISIQERTAELKSVLSKKTDGNSTIIGKRLQFMLDMICDIKNNKRRPKDELVVHSRLKKWLQKLGVDEVQLRAVTWAGLLDPDKKGQWWLPGAPGSGSGDVAENVRAEVAGVMDVGTAEAEKMLQLAASQRMNTDGRRAVFCIVMSSEDYIDAFEKILRLKLPGKQDREVVRVILECCLQEQLYNKYYSLLTAKLCHHDKNHKFSLQYCLWDHYKQLHAMELRRSTNLARLTASVHAHIIKSGMQPDIYLGNTLLNMYANTGSVIDTHRVFDKLPQKDVVSWNTMIVGYAKHGYGEEAFRLFHQMQQEGFKPDTVTCTSTLKACTGPRALEWGKHVHSHIMKAGYNVDVRIGNALIDMYAKCGSLEAACQVFDVMPERDVISWTAMIVGLAQHGCGEEALQVFEQMRVEGVEPNAVTFVGVLSACSHAGLVEEAYGYFSSMCHQNGISPVGEHYGCMVDLLGRGGHLKEAEDLIKKMPVEADATIWGSLLGACRTHGNVELAECAAENCLQLEPKDAAVYVLLSHIYAAAGMWGSVTKVRNTMKERGIQKEPGRCWIEVENKIHTFVAEDRTHPQTEEIYAELDKLTGQMKEGGYVADTHCVMHDVDEGEREQAICYHSERLAIVYGLISTEPGTPIHIFKNLRVCSDCHTATKIISKIVKREIVARDANRFHHFKDGSCSCGDYW